MIKWYGKRKSPDAKRRSEYRLTRFGKGFPYLTEDSVGDLFILIPESQTEFLGYVLDLDDDIAEIQSALGIGIVDTWGVFRAGEAVVETEEDCIERHFREFAAVVDAFPTGQRFSETTRQALIDCIRDFATKTGDIKLVRSVDAEYRLFRLVERKLCEPQIHRLFPSVDEFLRTAGTILNRRKSRAGRSFENHVEYLLQDARVPFKMRPDIEGVPDVVIPGKAEYDDPNYPRDRVFVLGLKTTCKDRWRQVLEEAPLVPQKHIFTLQRGISAKQLDKMARASVTLIVPKALHELYPSPYRERLLTVDGFINQVRERLAV